MRASQAGIGAIPDGTNHLSIPHGPHTSNTAKEVIAVIETPKDRYFITRDGIEGEVTKHGFIDAEREAGFHPKREWGEDISNTLATGGFGGKNGRLSGRIVFA